MEGLEDAWPRFRYFLHTIGHAKLFFFSNIDDIYSFYIVTSTEQS